MASNDDLVYLINFITLSIGVMTGFYGVSNGGMIGKSIVNKIGSSIDDMFVQGMFDVLIQRDIADAVGALIGTLVGGLTPPFFALIFSEMTTMFMKRSTKKFVEREEDEYNETETEYTKPKGNEKQSNKSKTNKKPKPNNQRQSNGTQNNQTRTETKWRDVELENAYKLLGVNYDATMDEIESRYRRLTLKYHPDKGGSYDSWHKLGKALVDIKKERNIPI